MSTAPVRRGIYGKLAGDTTLNSLLGTPAPNYAKSIYYGVAPQSRELPVRGFHEQDGRPTEAFSDPSAFETDIWMVRATDRGTDRQAADTAEAIQARVAALLNDAGISISGSAVMYLRRQSDMDFTETDEGVMYHHAGSLYRLVYD